MLVHRRLLTWIITAAIALLGNAAFALSAKDIEAEIKMGNEAAQAALTTMKFITDESVCKRVETIGQKLAAVAKTQKIPASYGSSTLTDFDYVFKVANDDDANAASLPAGFIFVNKGLLDRVESDDELAGVLAHEIAHVAHHHMWHLLQKQSKYDAMVFAIMAAALAGKGSSESAYNLYMGAQLLEISKLNTYTQEAERDADKTAIAIMHKAGYNPVGMLTFMEKLARDHAYNTVEYGVFQDHPYSRERADYIIAEIKQLGIPINRRAVTTGYQAFAEQDEDKRWRVMIDSRLIFQPADTRNSPAADRAKTIVEALNKALDDNPSVRDIRQDGASVYVKQSVVVEVRQEDADLAGLSIEDLAAKVKQAVQTAVISESIKLIY